MSQLEDWFNSNSLQIKSAKTKILIFNISGHKADNKIPRLQQLKISNF